MAYAIELGEVVMSPRMSKIKALLAAIDEMKEKIIEVSIDDNLSYAEKTVKLEEMRKALIATEHYTLMMMDTEIKAQDGDGKDGDGHGWHDGHDGHDGEDGV